MIDLAEWDRRFRAQHQRERLPEPECGDCGATEAEVQHCRDRYCPFKAVA